MDNRKYFMVHVFFVFDSEGGGEKLKLSPLIEPTYYLLILLLLENFVSY